MHGDSTISDEEIILVVRTKEKEWYREIIKRYEKKLLRYANNLLHDEQKAADVVQESFINAYTNLHSFDVKKKFSSWIYRIVHNAALNAVGKEKKQQLLKEYEDIKSDVDIEDAYIREELISHTHACLDAMPLKYKEPLSLFFLEEKSYEEISDILRIPLGTVGTRITRAKGMMKKICQRKNI